MRPIPRIIAPGSRTYGAREPISGPRQHDERLIPVEGDDCSSRTDGASRTPRIGHFHRFFKDLSVVLKELHPFQ